MIEKPGDIEVVKTISLAMIHCKVLKNLEILQVLIVDYTPNSSGNVAGILWE